jgi:hypothetical protein
MILRPEKRMPQTITRPKVQHPSLRQRLARRALGTTVVQSGWRNCQEFRSMLTNVYLNDGFKPDPS